MTRLGISLDFGAVYFLTLVVGIQSYCNHIPSRRCYNRYNCYDRTFQCNSILLPFNDVVSTDGQNFDVIIQNSVITKIPPASFLKLTNVHRLDLSHNQITSISPGAFTGLHRLSELSLSNNELTKIPQGIFNSLIELKYLDISYNQIININSNFLTGTLQLNYLNLSNNHLESFDDATLGQNRYFEVINLNSNNISELNLSDSSNRINTLDISNNSLTSIDVRLPGLVNLNASANKIRTLLSTKRPFFRTNLTLSTLDVSYNLLDELTVKNITYLSTLIRLNLAGNNLTFIPTNLFVNFSLLLDLNVSQNNLKKLDYGTLDHLDKLVNLDLSHNQLTSLNRYLHSLNSLTTLYINDNKLTNIDAKQILQDMPRVEKINFAKNDLSCNELVAVIHTFGYLRVVKGTDTNGSNIHGISCNEEEFAAGSTQLKFKDTVIQYLENAISSKLANSEGNEFDRSVMYNYFNKDFKDSNFYKYLESFKNINPQNFNETNMAKYFNEDFRKSKFYEYLESLKANENSTIEFNRSLYNYFNNDFNDSNLIKYFKKLEESKSAFVDDFENSSMYKYFNEGFKKSGFYQFLENFKSKSDSDESQDFKSEYLHDYDNNNNRSGNPGLLSAITVLLIILVVFKSVQFYITYNRSRYSEREHVELMS